MLIVFIVLLGSSFQFNSSLFQERNCWFLFLKLINEVTPCLTDVHYFLLLVEEEIYVLTVSIFSLCGGGLSCLLLLLLHDFLTLGPSLEPGPWRIKFLDK